MNGYWPWWLGAVALAAVPVVHWLLLRRMFAVSGRVTSLVDHARSFGQPGHDDLSDAELQAALAAATAAEFGGAATVPRSDAGAIDASGCDATPIAAAPRARLRPYHHLLFFAGIAAGAWLGHGAAPRTLRSDSFARMIGHDDLRVLVALFGGGLLVGFGTRMAGGCTSGHGLCGVSRLQPGSLVTTAAFFLTAVGVALALARLT